jgi:hypothetical protein
MLLREVKRNERINGNNEGIPVLDLEGTIDGIDGLIEGVSYGDFEGIIQVDGLVEVTMKDDAIKHI